MEFSSQRLVDVFVAVPVGQIDHPNADALRLALAPTLDAAILAKGSIVLDFSKVTYISSMASGDCLAMRPEITESVPLLSDVSRRPWLVVESKA